MASGSNKMEIPAPDFGLLQGQLHIDQVDFDLVKSLTERFAYPPTDYIQQQGAVIEISLPMRAVCPNLLAFRPCSSFFDPTYDCAGVHPEFFYRDGHFAWLPCAWGCHAFQRKPIRHIGQTVCRIPNCRQLHRRGFHHCEPASFRAWALKAHCNQWFTVWNGDPDLNGKTPLTIIYHQDLVHCLCSQLFITPAKYAQHDWRDRVPAPLTKILCASFGAQPS